MQWNRAIFATVLLSLLSLSRAHAQEKKPAPPRVQHSEATIESGDKKVKVRIERFELPGKGGRPAIVLVPESKSLAEVGDVYRAIAGRLAEEGFVVLMVHFFDRTGHKKGIDDPKKIREEDFRAWMGAVRDAVQYAQKLPNVNRERVGLLGFSLGGFLCLSVAAEKELGVAAVASYFGGIPEKLWPHLRWLPPTLVVSGARDDQVSVSQSFAVAGFCQFRRLPCEVKIYDQQGHLFKETLMPWVALDLALQGFLGNDCSPAQSIARAIRLNPTIREAVEAGTAFFGKHLRPPKQ
jgi:dienelactone hydrolase